MGNQVLACVMSAADSLSNDRSHPGPGPELRVSQGREEDQNDISRAPPTCFSEFPPEILEQIFNAIPAQERAVAAAVCQPWRRAFLGTSSCWTGIQLGRNSNCFSTMSLSTRPTDYLPLSHIQEIQFTPAVPATMCLDKHCGSDPVCNQLREVPYAWLGLVLSHAPKLQSLDLSSLIVKDGNMDAFR